MLDPSTISPYLCQPPRDYRDFLDEQIARLETERRLIGAQLAMLREERERFADRDILRPSGVASAIEQLPF